MNKPLSEIIKQLEDKNALGECYLHHNWENGKLELNIEFDNKRADKILEGSGIDETDLCAFWE
jgi:hypothetical protein